jgi:tetratricopeptide (TPR) repeat protein
MNSKRAPQFRFLLATLLLTLAASGPLHSEKERLPQTARVTVRTGREGCTVEVDSAAAGKTDESGSLELSEVEPGDHYLHVRCPDEEEGRAHFISVSAGESVEIRHEKKAPAAAPPDPLAAAQARIELLQHLQDAVRLRARGNVEEAVRNLREALRLDPENADLHRELGITFLLAKEWKRARVEMLEAVRHMPDDADAYNGLGYALEKLGDLQAAIEAYRIATKLEPADSTYRQRYFGALAKLSAQEAEKKK